MRHIASRTLGATVFALTACADAPARSRARAPEGAAMASIEPAARAPPGERGRPVS